MSLAALVLSASLLAGVTPAEQVQIAEAYTQRGEPKKAIPLLTKALASGALSDAQKARAEATLGFAWLQERKPETAVAHLESSLKLDGKNERTWLLLGMAHDVRGRYDEAVAAYRRGTEVLPKSAELHHELGMSLLEAGEVEAGVKALGVAVELAPRHPDYLADQAYGLLRAGKFEDARKAAQLAVSRAPDNAAAFYTLGDAEAGLKNVDAARSAYQKTLEIDPTFAPALYHLAILEAEGERPVAAAKQLLRLLKVEPEHEKGRRLLLREASRLEPEGARKVLELAIKIDARWADAHALLGETELKAGDTAAAVKAFERAARLAPKDAAIKARLEEARAQAKQAGKASASTGPQSKGNPSTEPTSAAPRGKTR